MLLKVGELAKRTGLTVRTLHHYDQIGLLCPSGRSEGGYRQYDPSDVARLHGIQALRRIGLPLEEIGKVLDANGANLQDIIGRQLRVLDHEIAQATALRDRLSMLQTKYAAGKEPGLADWLGTLQLMAACDQYFSPAEVKLMFGNWRHVEAQWAQLVAEVRALMDAGVPALDARVQPLAHRWSSLMHTWMDGNMDLMLRWGRLYQSQPGLGGPNRPDLAMIAYIEQAVQMRLALFLRHLQPDDLRRLGPVPDTDWQALSADVQALIDAGTPADSSAAKALVKRWQAIGRRSSRGDAALWLRLQVAHAREPLLRASSPLTPQARDYLHRAAGFDPPAPAKGA